MRIFEAEVRRGEAQTTPPKIQLKVRTTVGKADSVRRAWPWAGAKRAEEGPKKTSKKRGRWGWG